MMILLMAKVRTFPIQYKKMGINLLRTKVKKLSAQIEDASAEVNTEPTEAQKEAGNYKKGHVQVGSFDIKVQSGQRTDDNSGSEGGKDSEGEVRTRDEGSDEQKSSSEESAVGGLREQETDVEQGEEANEEIKPIGKGIFGNIYDQFKGKAKSAINFLRKIKSGEAVGALHHSEVGDISLVWGNDKAGLKKILRKHPEVVDNLQGILNDMHIAVSSENRIVFESNTHRAVVSKMLGNEKTPQWLLTAYEKKNTSGGSSDIVPEPKRGKQNGTAPLQDNSSTDKVTESAPSTQENRSTLIPQDDYK